MPTGTGRFEGGGHPSESGQNRCGVQVHDNEHPAAVRRRSHFGLCQPDHATANEGIRGTIHGRNLRSCVISRH